jgi:hypothetical protein
MLRTRKKEAALSFALTHVCKPSLPEISAHVRRFAHRLSTKNADTAGLAQFREGHQRAKGQAWRGTQFVLCL